MVKPASRIEQIPPYLFARIDKKKAEVRERGMDLVDFGIGDPDKARIFVAIIDWNARHRVASGTKDPTGIWDPAETTQTAEGKLIAYGSLFVDKSTEGEQMVEATLPLNFYDPAAGRPTGKYSIIISCSTSAYGDYMVGCTTNVMYVDDFQWVY